MFGRNVKVKQNLSKKCEGEVFFVVVLVFAPSLRMATLTAFATSRRLPCSPASSASTGSTASSASTSTAGAVHVRCLVSVCLVGPLEIITLAIFAFVKLPEKRCNLKKIIRAKYLPWLGPSFLTVSRIASLLHEH